MPDWRKSLYRQVCELRERIAELEAERDRLVSRVQTLERFISEVSEQRIAELEAERDRLREALDAIYPTLAGRVIQLQQAGEENAAQIWNRYCIEVREALTTHQEADTTLEVCKCGHSEAWHRGIICTEKRCSCQQYDQALNKANTKEDDNG